MAETEIYFRQDGGDVVKERSSITTTIFPALHISHCYLPLSKDLSVRNACHSTDYTLVLSLLEIEKS
jgi:hypothetical protein